jgi:hypothetical protein
MQRTIWSLAIAVAALAITTQSASAGQFKKAVYYKAGERPYQVVVTHVTNGPNLDLVIGNYLSGQVAVLLGNGDGTFQQPRTFTVPSPIGIAVGDLDGDGKQDVAVVESGGTGKGALGVFLGNGDGTFHKSATYVTGIMPVSVAIADFNGDGHLDLAVTDSDQFHKVGDVKVFFGDGKGKLGKPATYKVAGAPWSIAAGDLNGDKFPDLVVTQGIVESVAVLLNDGSGKFRAPVSYSVVGSGATKVKIADLRNAGKEDLVVASLSEGMVVLLNKGNGTFGKPTVYPPACHNCQAPEDCAVADFNLDGNLDVVCATTYNGDYFFYGDGKGKFGDAIFIGETMQNDGGYSIAAGDFNNDQAPDLAIPIELKGKVAIMLNTK